MRLSRICVWACPAKFLAKILIRPVFGSVRFRVFVRRRGRRVPGRGATSAARQDKKIAGPGGSEGPRIPPQRSLSLWAISQTPRARKDAHTCRWAWTEKRAVLGVSRRGDQWILFGLPVRARQVAEPDLKGRSTGRSDTYFAAADARYGRGRPCDACGACWGGRDGRLETFFPAKNDGRLTQWQSATNRGKAQSAQPRISYYYYNQSINNIIIS